MKACNNEKLQQEMNKVDRAMYDLMSTEGFSKYDQVYRRNKPVVSLDNKIPRDIHLDFLRMIQSAKRHFASMDNLSLKIESAMNTAEKNVFKEHRNKIKKLQKE